MKDNNLILILLVFFLINSFFCYSKNNDDKQLTKNLQNYKSIIIDLKKIIDKNKKIEINLGQFSPKKIDDIIKKEVNVKNIGDKFLKLSDNFVNIEYLANTNIGQPEIVDKNNKIIQKAIKEKLTVNLSGMDCVTFIENAMGLVYATDYKSYLKQLQIIKYENAKISYKTRNHYMSNWLNNNHKLGYIDIITDELGIKTTKINRTMCVLKEITAFPVTISYIEKSKVKRC